MKISKLILVPIVFFILLACNEKKNNNTNTVLLDKDISDTLYRKINADSLKADNESKRIIKEDNSRITKLLANNNNVRIDSIYKVDYINKYPKDFGGIGYYITYDTTKIALRKFIFITDDAFSDNSSIAMLRINDKDIFLQHDTINIKNRIKDLIEVAWTGQGVNPHCRNFR